MKIGILTFHRAYNCGAMLQAYALKTVLERMGHEVEFPACNRVGDGARFMPFNLKGRSFLRKLKNIFGISLFNLLSIGIEDRKRFHFRKFRQAYLPERECLPVEFERLYDCLIVGSDQVWNPNCAGLNEAPLFLLENFSFSKPIVAYAVSCGDVQLDAKSIRRIQAAANRCMAVSVREPLVNTFLTGDYPLVPDPTLLLTRDDYEKGLRLPCPTPRKRKLLYCFTLDASPFVVSTARALAKRLDADCVIQPTYQFSRWGAPRGLTYGLSPDGMARQMFSADYVLASSFHGTVFAIHSGKPFLSLREQVDELESRPASLLRQLHMSERLVNPTVSIEAMEALLRKPLPFALSARLGALREAGEAFLSTGLPPPPLIAIEWRVTPDFAVSRATSDYKEVA